MCRLPVLRLLIAALLALPSHCATCTRNTSSTATCALNADALYDPYSDDVNDVAAPFTVSSIADCANQCARRRVDSNIGQVNPDFCFEGQCVFCASFAFDASTSLCRLFGESVSNKFIKPDPSSDLVFYDLDCFDCGAVCPQPYNQNLLDNGDFEQSSLGPWQNPVEEDKSSDYADFKSVLATVGGSQVDQCYGVDADPDIYQPCTAQAFNVCPGSLYTVQFDYSVPAHRGKSVHAQLGRSWSHTITIEPSANDTSWKTVRSFFRGNANGALSFYYALFGRGDRNPILSIDNAAVNRIRDPPALLAGAKSVFRNGGFESGVLLPWKGDGTGDYRVVSPGLRGSKNALLVTTSGDRIGFIKQAIPTKPATSYLLSFDYANATATGDAVVEFFFGRRGNSTQNTYGNLSSGTNTITLPFYADDTSTVFFIRPFHQHTIMLDNFSLIELANNQF